MTRFILVTDIGSTTTKALLLSVENGKLVQAATADEPTTVEKPHEDVRVGLFRAVDRLSSDVGFQLREGRSFTVPYYTTSSAGGGLQILVIGLSMSDTGKVAEATIFAAGGVLLDRFAIDDGIPKVVKIQRISRLSPDLVLMAGGHEGGAIAGVVNMAQILSEAAPRPKFGEHALPVIFCGNTAARPFVKEMLGPGFDVHFTENIRPSTEELNLRPAVDSVHALFMNHVMQMAPGYQAVAEAASAPVLPTPTGVERLLSLFSGGRKLEALSWDGGETDGAVLADMGGATTDIFSLMDGRIERTVSANTGMSYSLSNILKEAGVEKVMRHLEGAEEALVIDRVLEKTLFPTIRPEEALGFLVEHACAAEGMRLAFEQHMDMSYRREPAGFFQKLMQGTLDPAFRTREKEKRFTLADMKVFIGAGGVLAHADKRRAAWILAQGFGPRGVTTLAVDERFHSPHMGVLGCEHPEMAEEYYATHCLKKLCRVVTPRGTVRDGRPALEVRGPSGETVVRGGDCLFIEDGKGHRVGEWEEEEPIPLLVDCRRDASQTLPMDFEKRPIDVSMARASSHRETAIGERESMSRTFSLAYPGEIHVSEGEDVEPGTLLGENRLAPPRVYFVDVRRGSQYLTGASTEEVMGGITVKPGDEVSSGMEIFHLDTRRGVTGAVHKMNSPVRGIVTDLLAPGVIRMREIQDYDGRTHVVDIAGPLRVKPKQIRGYLRVAKGDFVHRGHLLATGTKMELVKSPSAGTVMDIDREKGSITIKYVTTPIALESPLFGRVKSVGSGIAVEIELEAHVIEGVLGLGRDVFGPLRTSPKKGAVVLSREAISAANLEAAVEAGAAAIVGPSMSGELLSRYLGRTPGVLLTGGEDLPVSLMLLRGVGHADIEPEAWGRLSDLMMADPVAGAHAVLLPTTRLRAGVERPTLLIQ